MNKKNHDINEKIENVKETLTDIINHSSPTTFSSSYGAEDMVLMDIISRFFPEIKIFTLDTGRLHEKTHALIQRAREHYNNKVDIYFPSSESVESFITDYGTNVFYSSRKARKDCCGIRKVEPLRRALKGKQSWITGMRRDQGMTRHDLALSEWDESHQIQKYNPLIYWSHNDVWDYIDLFKVPYNELHDEGYISIGCAPCTRAVNDGEDPRAGRWWWEDEEHKECGLHIANK